MVCVYFFRLEYNIENLFALVENNIFPFSSVVIHTYSSKHVLLLFYKLRQVMRLERVGAHTVYTKKLVKRIVSIASLSITGVLHVAFLLFHGIYNPDHRLCL